MSDADGAYYGEAIGWDDLLDPGERILWQGRPERGFSLRPFRPIQMLFGAGMMGFALLWMAMASWITAGIDQNGPFALFPYFGLIFLFAGAWNAGLSLIWAHVLRQRSVYSLSTQRAFIATSVPLMGRRLKSWPIDQGSVLELDDSQPGHVWFAKSYVDTKHGSQTRRVGFERLAEPRKVYGLMRQIKRGAA
ncbi:hypothetical protein [Tropicibacter naphthalenivorans]|uniref:Integral membrane protein n=1 Tax=Tropicibacter naphthalenivorans TaxID=441103 RepID=A0A0P1G031_9RHOB|nr:hypothetical protein [Tropicibacter naphthalenivorans]CUH75063.1 hypothetical protein TRN7648_00238 [Tropicibacter naphthalenivorans]SMC46997.1 hypothetical protein SAMN04488093_101642 [Tropicibacter naphthalenivorans]